jgi:hypothetical protein
MQGGRRWSSQSIDRSQFPCKSIDSLFILTNTRTIPSHPSHTAIKNSARRTTAPDGNPQAEASDVKTVTEASGAFGLGGELRVPLGPSWGIPDMVVHSNHASIGFDSFSGCVCTVCTWPFLSLGRPSPRPIRVQSPAHPSGGGGGTRLKRHCRRDGLGEPPAAGGPTPPSSLSSAFWVGGGIDRLIGTHSPQPSPDLSQRTPTDSGDTPPPSMLLTLDSAHTTHPHRGRDQSRPARLHPLFSPLPPAHTHTRRRPTPGPKPTPKTPHTHTHNPAQPCGCWPPPAPPA